MWLANAGNGASFDPRQRARSSRAFYIAGQWSEPTCCIVKPRAGLVTACDDDTYFYARGDGNDTITEAANGGNADKLVLTDISPGSVTLLRNGIDVTLVIAESAPGAGDGGSILLKETLDDF
jgi:hypothetical protein